MRWMALLILLPGVSSGAQPGGQTRETEAMPLVPPGFTIQVFAREPMVRNPCAMAFDDRGRLCVGIGPQFRSPKPDTPGDRIVILEDTDGDGVADLTKTFAEGLNCIQGMAWRGGDLWVGNAPDLTVLRDVDGDAIADEYIKIYTDLGNLEHGIHGLTWAPDGMLYFSKGNSKGRSLDGDSSVEPGLLAPQAFRQLWGVPGPKGSPELPPPQVFHRRDYRRTYQDPESDWGREGGILRCDFRGRGLEIVSRGCRNPWDIAFDSGFNWLGTDTDETGGDKFIMPFKGAHFGWNHPWSRDWAGFDSGAATVAASGPLLDGCWTGIEFIDSLHWPAAYRGSFLVNDWLRTATYLYRPCWEGASMKPAGQLEPFIQSGEALFQPVDVAMGPDSALYVSGWGREYGAVWKEGSQANAGRIFRITPAASATQRGAIWRKPKRSHPRSLWTTSELIEDIAAPLAIWRVNAQEELTRRGLHKLTGVFDLVSRGQLAETQETWLLWVIGRALPRLNSSGDPVSEWLRPEAGVNRRVQALRISAWRKSRSSAEVDAAAPEEILTLLNDPSARIRHEAIQALKVGWRLDERQLFEFLDRETDPVAFYAAWDALRGHRDLVSLKSMLNSRHGGSRRGLLLLLLEQGLMTPDEVRSQLQEPDAELQKIARRWLAQAEKGPLPTVIRGRSLPALPGASIRPPPRPSTLPAPVQVP